MKVQQKKWIRFRTYVVAIFFVLGLGVMLARAYQLQVSERARLTALAKANYRDRITLPSKRGGIYDRQGHALALTVEVGSVYARPSCIKKKQSVARKVARALRMQRRKVLSSLRSKHSFVWVKRRIPPPMIEKIKALGIDGIGVVPESRRYYPGRETAAHLIGFVGADNQGLEGLEKIYDSLLKGPPTRLLQLQDALGRPFLIQRTEPSGFGLHDLVLTIDKDIQFQAQQALEAAVRKAKAKSGQCLVVNPRTGEILALAVVPEFNPNIFSRYRPEQWRNRVVTDCYEPGSTMKAFLLAAALEEHVVNPQTRFHCENGTFGIAGKTIHDTHPYNILSVQDIIKYSSNIGALKMGRALGYGTFARYLGRFGFGRKTGIRLLGEQSGFVRSSKKAKEIEKITAYFGQGMTVTTLQLAMAMGALANGGELMRPFVVSRVRDSSGKVTQVTKPRVVRRVLTKRTCRRVSRILEGVVEEEGTGSPASIRGFRVAGKTGTAQKVDPRTRRYSSRKYEAIFAGFVPVDDPKLVIVVMVDEPKGVAYGGIVAGPVFREVGQWALNYMRVSPRVEVASAKEVPKPENIDPKVRIRMPIVSQKGNGHLPDFKGQTMREVLRNGKALGLKVVLKGTGLAYKQFPRPGIPLKKVSVVKVRFRPPA
ncbi:MAG: transpeptidase family protein [Deltaproteobacteria bacterium]|nr:transpeptidase family protein [Deltaproteobacteria bacterium]